MLAFLPAGGICVLCHRSLPSLVKRKGKKWLPGSKTTHKTALSNSSSGAEVEGCSQHLVLCDRGVLYIRITDLPVNTGTHNSIYRCLPASAKIICRADSLGSVSGTRNFMSHGSPWNNPTGMRGLRPVWRLWPIYSVLQTVALWGLFELIKKFLNSASV